MRCIFKCQNRKVAHIIVALNKEMTKEYTHSCETLYMKVRLVTYLDKCFKNCDGGKKSSVRETFVVCANSSFPLFVPVIKGCVWIEHELPSAGKYRRVSVHMQTVMKLCCWRQQQPFNFFLKL